MDEELIRIYSRLNQLMGISLAQDALIGTLFGTVALRSKDWRETIANLRMMAEYNIKGTDWAGTASEGETIRSIALEHLTNKLDDLHKALAESEKEGFNPRPPTKP